MSIETAVKFIIVLLVILIVTLTAVFFLVNRDDTDPEGETTSVTTTAPSTTGQKPTTSDGATSGGPATTTPQGSGSDAPATTDPIGTTPEGSDPVGTTPEGSDPVGTTPGLTEPTLPAPEDFTFYGSYLSESGTALNLRAEVVAYATESGQVKVKVELYLDHFSLYLGTRNGCSLTVGGVTETFSSEAIRHDGGRTSTLITSIEMFCGYGETLTLEAYFPCRCTYGAVEIEALSIAEQIVLE